jgi:hypothetical protein
MADAIDWSELTCTGFILFIVHQKQWYYDNTSLQPTTDECNRTIFIPYKTGRNAG